MGRTVDRKTEILEAVCRVIARTGVHDLRVEDVAAEANVSTALIYYYFDTRSDLLDRAFEFADARSTSYTLGRLDLRATARKQLEDILSLELDKAEEVTENWVMWAERGAAAVWDEELRTSIRRSTAHWNHIVRDLIVRGSRDGSIAADVDPDDASQRITTVVDGIGTEWMLGILSQERARALVREALDLELGTARG